MRPGIRNWAIVAQFPNLTPAVATLKWFVPQTSRYLFNSLQYIWHHSVGCVTPSVECCYLSAWRSVKRNTVHVLTALCDVFTRCQPIGLQDSPCFTCARSKQLFMQVSSYEFHTCCNVFYLYSRLLMITTKKSKNCLQEKLERLWFV